MAVNISSRVTTLTIGSQDWSAWIDPSSGIQIGTPEYECGKGLLIASGTINLIFPANFKGLPSSPLFLANPSQWKRGQTVSIQVGGNYLNCSGQALYILAIPEEPKREIGGTATMSLSVGCRLALENFPPEPNQDISGVTVGTSLNRGTVIANILNYLGITNSIGSLPYPIDYALPKTSGNFLQMAGKLADEAGYHLRCDVDGTVIAAPNTLTYGTSAIAYQIGRDEKLWESIGKVSEQPLEKTVVTGVQKNIAASDNNNQILEELPLNQVSSFAAFESVVGLVPSKRTTKTAVSLSSGIFQTTELIEEPVCKVSSFTAFESVVGLIPSKKTITTYFLQNGLVYKTQISVQEPVCKVSTATAFEAVTGLIPSHQETNTWTKISDGKWIKKTLMEDPLCKVSTATAFESVTGLVPSSNITDNLDTSGAPTSIGDIGSNTTSDRQISVTVKAQQLAEDPYRPRERTINLEYANTEAQLTAYGENFNRFLTGRSQGKQFGGAIPTSTDFVPFNQVAVTDPSMGLVYYLKIDSIQYVVNQTEAVAVFNGILCGSAPVATPTEVTRPVEIVLGVSPFLIQGSAFITVPDYLPVSPFLIDGSASITVPDYLSLSSIFLIRS
jgi:hypothetical protein